MATRGRRPRRSSQVSHPVVTEPAAGCYLRVALDTPLRHAFDYLPPHDDAPVAAGARVVVPFGRQRRIGIVIEVASHSLLPAARLKRVTSVLDAEPALDSHTLALVQFAADYYQHPLGEVVASALPAALRAGRALEAIDIRVRLTDAAAVGLRLGPRQRALLERLAADASVETAALTAAERATLPSLVRRGLVERHVTRRISPRAVASAAAGPALTPAQSAAVAAITERAPGFAAVLLAGVTGSGKTEVYLRLIERVLAAGRRALVLVPEIGLTPQAIERFQHRLGVRLSVLHSGLTDGERLEHWRAARQGAAPVVLGTRSAVFAPLPDLGLIVVDEEHDGSYKQQEGFRYSARDLAVWRARAAGVPVVLGSATPSLESLANVADGRYLRLDLPERTGSAGEPKISLVDLGAHATSGALATPAALAIGRHLAAGGQVLLYLNRRGFAPTLFCPGCGWAAPCPNCDSRLTVHRREHRLVCHHCGAQAPIPFACPQCQTELVPLGQGTERLEDTLDRLFPGVPVLRIDRDTIRRRGELETALAQVHTGAARILVGTQMLTKGHDFPDVTLVVVIDADQGLFGTDFRSSERLAQNIIQVAGRAGRASRPGEVLVQTACPDHPLLVRLLSEGYEGFARAALQERAAAHWPPYSRLALLRAEAAVSEIPMEFLRAAREAAALGPSDGIRLLGPAPAAMERRAGRFRAQLLLEAAGHGALKRLLLDWVPRLEALPQARRVRWSLDVDPLEVS
jgi:primosomal protein N' (replication factor Y) (superfamily II helicase)